MLKVRLARTGKRGQPSYRIVVMEARTSRQGRVADTLGWYNPNAATEKLSIDMAKYEDWVKKGAQPTDSVLKLVLPKEEKEKRWPTIAKKETAPAQEA
ncbi:MAG: 30S ribosomal protein S16 [Candidatus Dojkabacteria bacterium]|nr:MAG: 30S ribosomal protein S16 [Candidatus Dojkabacteria bacterium]